jgi:hypothetical protein
MIVGTAAVVGVAGAGLFAGTGDAPGLGLTDGLGLTGGAVIAGEGAAAGTEAVGFGRVQADKQIVLIPISNLRYFMLNCKLSRSIQQVIIEIGARRK